MWLYTSLSTDVVYMARTIASLPALCFIPIGNTEVAGAQVIGRVGYIFIFLFLRVRSVCASIGYTYIPWTW